jgi:hypothetical protein
VSAFSHTSWTVICNGSDEGAACMDQANTDTMGLRDATARYVRRVLKHQGWAVAIRDADGSRQRLDFCPRHKPEES